MHKGVVVPAPENGIAMVLDKDQIKGLANDLHDAVLQGANSVMLIMTPNLRMRSYFERLKEILESDSPEEAIIITQEMDGSDLAPTWVTHDKLFCLGFAASSDDLYVVLSQPDDPSQN
jgi:hypothetical protein